MGTPKICPYHSAITSHFLCVYPSPAACSPLACTPVHLPQRSKQSLTSRLCFFAQNSPVTTTSLSPKSLRCPRSSLHRALLCCSFLSLFLSAASLPRAPGGMLDVCSRLHSQCLEHYPAGACLHKYVNVRITVFDIPDVEVKEVIDLRFHPAFCGPSPWRPGRAQSLLLVFLAYVQLSEAFLLPSASSSPSFT